MSIFTKDEALRLLLDAFRLGTQAEKTSSLLIALEWAEKAKEILEYHKQPLNDAINIIERIEARMKKVLEIEEDKEGNGEA